MYVEALQNTGLCFRGTKLADGRVQVDKLGRPRPISGAFASVFSVTTVAGHRYAVKCFTREVTDQETRYRAISDHLASLSYDWKVDFEYVSHGILVEGKRYPVLTMEWIEANNLTRWIDDHLHEPSALLGLADRFFTLTGELSAAGIGHGDLQHGNVLITRDGAIRLVDYDGMYVPKLAGLPAAENGHRNYQSPDRTAQDFGPAIDRFSEWVVYLSLFAVGVDPGLWRQLRESSAEQLLLAEDDFRAPESSFRISTLLGHPEPAVRDLAQRFQNLLNQPLAAMPPVSHVAAPLNLSRTTTDSRPNGLPPWMSDHVTENPAPVPQLTFGRRSTPLRLFGFFTFALLLAGAILTALGPIGLPMVTFSILSMITWFICTGASYRKQPESRAAATARARNSDVEKRMAAADKALATLHQLAHKMGQADASRQAEQTKRQQQLLQRHERDKAASQRAIHQQLADINTKLRVRTLDHDRDKQAELGRLQNLYIHSQLSAQRISSASISGISTALTSKLRSSGIATAADFIRIEHWQGKVVFRLANHGQVHVPGIGDTKAGRLMAWRNGLETRARASQPTTLPAATKQAMDAQYATAVAGLHGEKQRLNDEVARSDARLTAKFNLDRTDLIDQFRRENTAAAQTRAEHDRKLSQARRTADAINHEKRAIVGELAEYRRISFRAYLGLVLFSTR